MPVSPSPSTAVGRPDLAATLTEFDIQANQAGFVGLQLFPVVEVAEQSANIGKIPIEQLLQDQETTRASGGGYREGNFTFTDFSYATEEHGWTERIDERNARIYRRFFDAEVVAARRARNFVLQNFEKRVVTAATATGTFTNAAATAVWSNVATGVPITDVLTRTIAVRNASGMTPNVVVMDWEAFMRCRETNQVIDRLKYAGIDDPKMVTANALAQLFNVRRVIISGGLKNTAAEGGLTLAAQWTKTVVAVGYVAETDDVAEPCVGRTMHWSEDGSNIGTILESYWHEDTRATKIRARMETDELVMYPECWQLITGVL
jgi:hypothetical protein